MPAPLSHDLRLRVVAAVRERGMTIVQAATVFAVSDQVIRNWLALLDETGDVTRRRMGGDKRSHLTERHADLLNAIRAETPDATLREYSETAAERGVSVSATAVFRFFKRHGVTRKAKSVRAAERDREDVKAKREEWERGMGTLDASQVLFADETGADTRLTRTHGRCPAGERLVEPVRLGGRERKTLVAAVGVDGVVATKVIDGAVNADGFVDWVVTTLLPVLRPGMTLVLDNLRVHKDPRVRDLIVAHGARLAFIPPYSPDLNPIERCFAVGKGVMRKIAARTGDAVRDALSMCLDTLTPRQCRNCIADAGYAFT